MMQAARGNVHNGVGTFHLRYRAPVGSTMTSGIQNMWYFMDGTVVEMLMVKGVVRLHDRHWREVMKCTYIDPRASITACKATGSGRCAEQDYALKPRYYP